MKLKAPSNNEMKLTKPAKARMARSSRAVFIESRFAAYLNRCWTDMTASEGMAEPTYAARLVQELRRLTNSTFGLTYAELNQLSQMNKAELLGAFGNRLAPFGESWLDGQANSTPEQLARAIVDESQRRAAEAGRQWEPDVGSLLLDVLLGLGK